MFPEQYGHCSARRRQPILRSRLGTRLPVRRRRRAATHVALSWGILSLAISIHSWATEPTLAPFANGPASIAPAQAHFDPAGDAVARRTDSAQVIIPEEARNRIVDLLHLSVGMWEPDAADEDLFAGQFSNSGSFFRLDVRLQGVVNPPGSIDPFSFTPFRYGPRPVFGFIEIDMDGDIDTGGEIDAPEYRYLGNIARFGGNVTRPDLRPRVALTGTAIDNQLHTPPFVERSGEDFHLALLGEEFDPGDIEVIVGDSDRHFEPGETWNLLGRFFHRAHGYEPFAVTDGGSVPGAYEPLCTLRFDHDSDTNTTVVSLVFPLTNTGAGMMANQPPQPNDQDPTNQASILEALEDLQLSAKVLAEFPTDQPGSEVLMNWATRDPRRGLNINGWRMTALLGTSYSTPNLNAVQIVWTDAFPNVIRGDIDGSGSADLADAIRIAAFVAETDDHDGLVDDRVRIPNFARNFAVADVNYDGYVDFEDIRLADRRGDHDDDGDVDLYDLARFQTCFGRTGGSGEPGGGCQRMDLTGEGRIDLDDLIELRLRLSGPGRP